MRYELHVFDEDDRHLIIPLLLDGSEPEDFYTSRCMDALSVARTAFRDLENRLLISHSRVDGRATPEREDAARVTTMSLKHCHFINHRGKPNAHS